MHTTIRRVNPRASACRAGRSRAPHVKAYRVPSAARRRRYSGAMRSVLVLLLSFAGCSDTRSVPAPSAPTVAAPDQAPAPFALPSGNNSITPSFTTDGEDLLYVWQEPDGTIAAGEKPIWRVRFSRRQAGAWSVPVDLARGTDILANWADFPSVGVGRDGGLVAHWFRVTSDAYEFAMARSLDRGATWTSLPAPFPAGLSGERGFVSYAAEPEGLRVYWLDGRDIVHGHSATHTGASAGATALRSARLGPTGFLPDELVDPRTCDCCSTDAVVAGGRSVVVYRDRYLGERRDIAAATSGAGGWSAGAPLGADGWVIHGCPVNGPAADALGDTVVTAWFTGADDRQSVRAAFSTDAGATFGTVANVVDANSDARPLGRVDVLLQPDGTALVVWLSAEGEDGRVRVRRLARDGRVGPSLAVGPSATARATGFPRLAWQGSQVVVAWTTPDQGNTAVSFDPALVAGVEGAIVSPDVASLPKIPKTLPPFELRDLSGVSVRADDLRGAPVLLNVWATWCGPCRDELPVLAKLQTEYPKLRVLALSVDGAGAGPAVRKMIEASAPGLVALHPDTAGLAARLGVSALPRTFLYDGSGALVWSSEGALREDDPALAAVLGPMVGP